MSSAPSAGSALEQDAQKSESTAELSQHLVNGSVQLEDDKNEDGKKKKKKKNRNGRRKATGFEGKVLVPEDFRNNMAHA